MTDNTMEYMTVSMCGADALDWCGGYNEAVTKANEIINRQNAEIERLKGNAPKILISDKTPSRYFEVKSQQPVLIYPYQETKIELVPSTEQTKAEAIKDFAERLKDLKHECGCNFRKKPVYAVTEDKIDNLVKEMIGEQE